MKPRPADWLAREPDASFAVTEARRFLRRGRRHQRWLVILGVLIAAGYLTRRALQEINYEGMVVMRIAEADRELTQTVQVSKNYSNLIFGAFLSAPRLRPIIERYKLYPDKYVKDPQLAIEAMRNDLDVKVWGDYFDARYVDYTDADEARTARVAVSWRSKDPELTLNVVRALGATIIEAQAEDRRAVFEAAQQDVAESLNHATRLLVQVRQALAMKRYEIAHSTGPAQAKLRYLHGQMEKEERYHRKRLEELRNARIRFEITAARERRQSGVRFEIMEPGVVTGERRAGPIASAIMALVIVGLTMFMGGVLFGAFETRVRHAADARRLGVEVLGSVPPFRGDSVGALVERLRAEDRLRLEKR